MPVNVLGGALEFDANINLFDFEKGISGIEKAIIEVGNKAIESSKKQGNAIDNILSSFGAKGSAIEETVNKIKDLQKQAEDFQNLITNTKDPELLAKYKTGLEAVQEQLEGAAVNLNKQVEEHLLNNVELAVTALQGEAGRITSAFSQLRNIKALLAVTDPNSEGYSDLVKQAAELQERLKGVNAEIKQSGSNAPALGALKEGLRGLVGGFEAVSGAMAFFGDNSKDVEKATRNVVAAMGVLNGVQEVSKILEKNSALNTFLLAQSRQTAAVATIEQAVATEGLAVAEGAEAVAAESAAVATGGLNAVMAANPALVLVLAITAVVAAMSYFSDSSDKAAEKQKEVNDRLIEAQAILKELAISYAEVYKEEATAADNAVALAEAQGKSEKEILQLKEKALSAKRLENVAILANLGYVEQVGNSIKQQLALKKTELDVRNEELQSHIKLNDLSKEDLALLESKVKILKGEYGPAKAAFDAIASSEAAQQNLAAEKAKKAHDDAIKSDVSLAEARLILAKKNTAEELAAQLAAIKERARQELDNVNLTRGERQKILAEEQKDIEEANRKYKILQLNNERSILQARLAKAKEGSAEELDLKIGLLNQTAAIEMQQDGLTRERKIQIRAEEAKAVAELTKKYNQQQIQDDINATISGLNTRLAMVKENAAEEVSIKKQLIGQKALLEINSATNSIKNEKLLTAKIIEINAKALADQQKLDDDFTERRLQNTFKVLERQTQLKNIGLTGVINDPNSTSLQKDKAQGQILENARVEAFTKILHIDSAIKKGAGDINKLLEQREDLMLKIKQIEQDIINHGKKSEKDRNDKLIKDLGKLKSTFSSLAGLVGQFDEGLGEALDTMTSMVDAGIDIATSVGQFASGDVLGGINSAISGLSKVASLLFSNPAEKKRQEELLAFNQRVFTGEFEINRLYRERALEQIRINKLRLEGIEAERKLLQEQSGKVQNDFKKVFDELQGQTAQVLGKRIITAIGDVQQKLNDQITQQLLNSGKTIEQIREMFAGNADMLINISLQGLSFEQLEEMFIKGQLQGKAKELFETLQSLKQQGLDINKALEDAKREAQEVFTGTTSDAILDSIVDGFKNGMHSAGDFAKNFEDLMRGAMINSLKFKYLEGPLKEFFEEFANASESDGQLSQTEIDALKNTYNAIIENADKQFQQLQQIAGINFSGIGGNANSIQGAFKILSEDTGSLIAGQFGGLRLTALDQLNVARQALVIHQNIENNTALTAVRLLELVRKFDAYETGAKKLNVQ